MRERPGTFVIAILAVAGLASLVDLGDQVNSGLAVAAKIGVAIVFFSFGVRLSPQQAWAGLSHWRLHLAILLITFALFPLVGLLIAHSWPQASPFAIGIVYVTTLPSTVQASVNAVSLARGNTAAAVVSASASNLLGIIITPLLVAFLIGRTTEIDLPMTMLRVFGLLLVPFAIGQLVRLFAGNVFKSYEFVIDHVFILFTVFVAFAAGRHAGVWERVGAAQIATVILAVLVLLAFVMTVTWWWARLWKFDYADAITVLFCGSQKSLTTGVPMAAIIFSAATLPLAVLPLMFYHQFQIIVGAALSGRLAKNVSGR